VTIGWRKLYNDELHFLYYSPSIIRMIKPRGEMGRACSRKGERELMLLVRKPEGKRPIVRPRRGWPDNIKMDLGDIGLGDIDRIGLAHCRDQLRALVNAVMNLRVP
jgi:hypothetical protein